jgi:putative oxidoreductase
MFSRQCLLLGRWLFSAIFIMSGVTHFMPDTRAMAAQQGVPAWLTVGSGLAACAGGLSVALGVRARWGAWLLVAFLVPVTLVMHRFWGLSDPQAAMMQFVNFMKNVSMLGGALAFAYFGSGPHSLDTARTTVHRPSRVTLREPVVK